MSVNISLIVLKKMNDILMIFVEIFHDFGLLFATRIRIRFIEADLDPDPADQNETDPNGSGSETLLSPLCHRIRNKSIHMTIFSMNCFLLKFF